MIDQHYTIKELSKLYNNSEDFWRKLVKSKEINAIKLGRSIQISETELRKFISFTNPDRITVEQFFSKKEEDANL